MKEVLNLEELLELLSISRSKFYELKKEGIPYYKIGKTIRFNRTKVLEWLEKYEVSDK